MTNINDSEENDMDTNNICENIESYSNDASLTNNDSENKEKNNIYNYDNLNKLKLSNIKDIAKKNNILLLKNNKVKNKQELINDILEKNI